MRELRERGLAGALPLLVGTLALVIAAPGASALPRSGPGAGVVALGASAVVAPVQPLAGEATAPPSPSASVERRLGAMGTELVVEVQAEDRPAALAAAEAAVRAVEAVEARLSTWRVDSELARLNGTPVDRGFPLSLDLAGDLAAAAACREATGGAFDPGVGALVEVWGLRRGGHLPSAAELTAALAATGLRHLALLDSTSQDWAPRDRAPRSEAPQDGTPWHAAEEDGTAPGGAAGRSAPVGSTTRRSFAAAAGRAVQTASGPGRQDATALPRVAIRLHDGLRLEEGAFGKGAALAEASALLDADPAVRRAVVDLGGQLVRTGPEASASPWIVAVADPGDRDRVLLEIVLDGDLATGSVATSGNSERGFTVDGRRHGHLLDPRSGRPVEDFGSLTVWAEDPLWADCLSTGLYVLGADRALAWAAARPGVEVLVVEPAGRPGSAPGSPPRVRASSGLAPRVRPVGRIAMDDSEADRRSARTAPGAPFHFEPNRPVPSDRVLEDARLGAAEPRKGPRSSRFDTAPRAGADGASAGSGFQEEHR